MPPPHPPEFRRRAVELARERAKPIAQIAADIGISESCLRNWLARADIDEGHKDGLTTTEREELVLIANPNDDPNVDGDEVLILASDRDYGLFIFQDP